jgi:hypothetical protein
MIRILLAAALALSAPAAASDEKHDHDHEAKVFATAAEGIGALAAAIAEAKTKTAAGDMEALHEISEELHGIAEGLSKRAGDVKPENRERFAFNVKQVDTLHVQLEAAHEGKDKAAVERLVKRLEDIHGRLMALSAP